MYGLIARRIGIGLLEEMGGIELIGHFALPIAALCFVIASQAIAIATLTVGINLIVDDISAHASGKLSERI